MSCESQKTITNIKRGSTFEQSLTFTDENGDVVNISGWNVESDLKISPEDDVLLSFNIDDSLFSQGVVTISAAPSGTQSLPADYLLQYDLKLTTPSIDPVSGSIECDFWDETEGWSNTGDWEANPSWDQSEIWVESGDWSCITTEEITEESEGGKVYYTDTLYLRTSRHITD